MKNTRKRIHYEKPYDFSNAKGGAVGPIPKGKTRITIRLDNDLIGWFKARVNEAAVVITKHQSTLHCASISSVRKNQSKRCCVAWSAKNSIKCL